MLPLSTNSYDLQTKLSRDKGIKGWACGYAANIEVEGNNLNGKFCVWWKTQKTVETGIFKVNSICIYMNVWSWKIGKYKIQKVSERSDSY